MPDGTCTDWKAWIDLMPGVEPKLYVTSTCEFPTTGYEVSLSRHEPQGANPRDLLLELKVKEPSGPVREVITEVEARYEEPVSADDFDTVSIRPDGPSGIKVKIVR